VNLTPNEILIICLVALIALGPKQLPETVRKIAKGFSEFRRQSSQLRAEVTSVVDRAVEESHDQELGRQARETDACSSQDPNPSDPQ
jgi:sec-independent protein translocase protein TatB